MSRFWRLPVTGLRFCAHTGGVQGQDGCGGSGMGLCSVLGCRRRLWQYLPSCVVNDWIGYMRYMLIYCHRINRVERYIRRKYILTAVIDSATKCSVL